MTGGNRPNKKKVYQSKDQTTNQEQVKRAAAEGPHIFCTLNFMTSHIVQQALPFYFFIHKNIKTSVND